MILKIETSKVFPLDLSLYFKTSMALNDVNIAKTRKLLYIESSLWKTMLYKPTSQGCIPIGTFISCEVLIPFWHDTLEIIKVIVSIYS